MAEPDLKTRFRGVIDELAGDDGDLGFMHDVVPAVTAFIEEYAAPGFVCAMCGLPPTPPVEWPGPEGIAEAWEDYGGAFEGVRVRVVEVRETERHLVLIVDQQVTTRHGGVAMSQPSAMVYEFDGERIKRVEFHLDRGAALASAGLAE